ncbi:exodeoxyribonuclease VII large subunit [Spiroplasma endosymbiont of Amphibalanus improvisus]|uniref:exodeoxyribonuclease VII large subunit n=1 Tax=Spiroplasma endosymbiont of Amphibalanus improvisus TaxID=3066327 RepID=UPI00313B54B0
MKLPLNVKTCYSFLNSTIRINEYVDYAKSNNLNFLAINDDNLFGSYEFYNSCVENNIKPIIGLSKTVLFQNKSIVLNFFAKNYDGYLELIQIDKIQESQNLSDIINLKVKNCLLVIEYKIFKIIKQNNFIRNDDIWFFSYDNEEEIEINKKIDFQSINILKKNQNDALNLFRAQNINNNFNVSFEEFDTNETNIVKFISNINLVIKKFNFTELEMKFLDSHKNIKDKCYQSLNDLNINNYKYKERLDYELSVINKMNFNNYFLVIWNYIDFAKKNNILFGPGRGSAAGSLVSYLLGITKIDPIKYDLLFERFLNPERITLPDIDIDFEDDKRDLIFEYLNKHYGKDHFAQIITFQSFGIKSSIKLYFDHIVKDEILYNKLVKIINANKISTFDDLENLFIQKEEINFLPININHFLSVIKIITGLPMNTSIHAAGIVLSNKDISKIIPVDNYGNFPKTKYKMQVLENIGFIKFDLLALHNLKIIHNILDNIYELCDHKLNLDTIRTDDQEVFKILNNKKTIGIFQLESTGMKNALQEIKTNSIDDIAAVSALYRPGPMDNISVYAKRKNKQELWKYEHLDLEPILSSTYGIIIYQEQIIQIVQKIAGFSLGEADIIRRAISKKSEKEMDEIKTKFIENSLNKNYSLKIVDKIWNLIAKFADYGFNKSHAISYAYISYQLSYLKVNYPVCFYNEFLNDSVGDDSKIQHIINEAKEFGVSFLSPNINNPTLQFKILNHNTIIIPITSIKIKNRINWKKFSDDYKMNKLNIYETIALLIKFNIEKDDLKILIQANIFQDFNISINKLLNNLNRILKFSNFLSKIKSSHLLEVPLLSNKSDVYQSDEKKIFGFYFQENKIKKLIIKYNFGTKVSKIINLFEGEIKNILGTISKVKIFTDKNNNQMCFFDLEDDTGTISVTVFSDEFVKLKDKISDGNFIIVKAVIEKYNGNLKAKLKSFKMLYL